MALTRIPKPYLDRVALTLIDKPKQTETGFQLSQKQGSKAELHLGVIMALGPDVPANRFAIGQHAAFTKVVPEYLTIDGVRYVFCTYQDLVTEVIEVDDSQQYHANVTLHAKSEESEQKS